MSEELIRQGNNELQRSYEDDYAENLGTSNESLRDSNQKSALLELDVKGRIKPHLPCN